MSYVLFVNPQVLGSAIHVPNGFAKLLIVTALAAAIGSLLMALVARYPFAQAPGMGLNAYFAYTVVLGQKIPWETALGAVFVSGALFVALSVLGVRQAVVRAIPNALKFAVTAGIGMFLAFLGLRNAGAVVAPPPLCACAARAAPPPRLSSAALWGRALPALLLGRGGRGAMGNGILGAT